MFDVGKDLQDAYEAGYEAGQYSKWNPASKPPKHNGSYLCQLKLNDRMQTIMEVLKYSTDLYKVDKYDFLEYKGKHVGGFYSYNSEWGYSEIDWVQAWMELPPEYEVE